MSAPKEQAPAPITKDDVRGNDPKPDAAVIPDRALVTGKIQEILAAGTPAPVDPISERLAQLEESLTPRVKPEHPAVHKEIQALRAELAERDRVEAERVAAEQRDAQLRTVREGFVESLRESEDFPAIVAAGFEEKIFNELFAKQQAGEEVSEAELLSKTEADLWELHAVLSELKSPTTSEDTQSQSEAPKPPTPTLTPSLTATDSPQGVEDIYEASRGDRRAAAAQLWDNIMNR